MDKHFLIQYTLDLLQEYTNETKNLAMSTNGNTQDVKNKLETISELLEELASEIRCKSMSIK
jgi:hypothetical protein